MKSIKSREASLLLFVHVSASVATIGFYFDQIERRLHRELSAFLAGYAIISIVAALSSGRFLTSQIRVALVAFALPYVACVIGFLVVALTWSLGTSDVWPNVSSSLIVSLVFPYLAVYGPAISLANMVFMWSCTQHPSIKNR